VWLLSPLAWVLVGLVVMAAGWSRRWMRIAAIALVVLGVVAMSPLSANALLSWLERPVRAPGDCVDDPPSTVVVLAGGVDGRPRDAADFGVLDLASVRRTQAGIRFWRGDPARRLVFVGGPVRGGRATHAGLMQALARWHGVPRSALAVEATSESTWENARGVARMSPRVPRRIVLATSASHMPRAALAFRSAGFAVCPLATDQRAVMGRSLAYLVPRTGALEKAESALHETVGLAYYRFLAARKVDERAR
jgi:uncharacterized SAM-binding protein YcdF (DUF218 family)